MIPTSCTYQKVENKQTNKNPKNIEILKNGTNKPKRKRFLILRLNVDF